MKHVWRLATVAIMVCMWWRSSDAQQLVGLTVTPAAVRVPAGEVARLTVSGVRTNGARASVQGVRFSSSDTAIASVDSLGRVLGKTPGIAMVYVAVDGLQRSVPVTVAAPVDQSPRIRTRVSGSAPDGAMPTVTPDASSIRKVRSIKLSPDSLRLLPTERANFQLSFEYEGGVAGPPTRFTVAIYGAAASLDSSTSSVVGIAPGAAVLGIRALDGPSLSVPITVVAANIAFDRDSLVLALGRADTVRVFTRETTPRRLNGLVWRSTNRQVLLPVDSSSGAVRAMGNGSADLIVDGYGATLRLPVVVHPSIAELRRSGHEQATVTLPTGLTTRLGALPRDAAGRILGDVPMRWEVGDSSILSYNATSQILTGRRSGTTTITARAPGVAALTWSVSVQDAQFRLDWRERFLHPGDERSLRGHWISSRGDTLQSTRALRWSTSTPGVISVTDSGVVRGLKQGAGKLSAVFDERHRADIDIPVTGDLLVTLDYGRDSLITGDLSVVDRRLTPINALAGATEAIWSPKRDRIAFVRLGASGKLFELAIFDPSTDSVARDASLMFDQSSPRWLEDNRRIAFVAGKSSSTRLAMHATADLEPQPFFTMARIQAVAKRSGVDEFYVVAETNKRYPIFRLRPSDSTATLVDEKYAEVRQLQVLRDGSMLVMADTSGGRERFAIARRFGDRDAMLDIQLPADAGQWRTFAMSPDERSLFVVVDNAGVRRGSIIFRIDLQSNTANELLRTTDARVRAISP